jgi:hypothetical protein
MTDSLAEEAPEIVGEQEPASDPAPDLAADSELPEVATEEAEVPKEEELKTEEAEEEPKDIQALPEDEEKAEEKPADEEASGKRKLDDTDGTSEQPEAKKVNMEEVRYSDQRFASLAPAPSIPIFVWSSCMFRSILFHGANRAPFIAGYADEWFSAPGHACGHHSRGPTARRA